MGPVGLPMWTFVVLSLVLRATNLRLKRVMTLVVVVVLVKLVQIRRLQKPSTFSVWIFRVWVLVTMLLRAEHVEKPGGTRMRAPMMGRVLASTGPPWRGWLE